MSNLYKKLGIIGCGNMAYALIRGLLKTEKLELRINDIQKERENLFIDEFSAVAAPLPQLVKESQIVLVAVKPQQVVPLLREVAPFWQETKLLVSIAAGITIAQMEQGLSMEASIVRIMPNTPALIGEGVLALVGSDIVPAETVEEIRRMFSGAGRTLVIEEKDMDAVVAISGSGPAYIFMILEAMTEAGVLVGLSADDAFKLAKATMKGSLALTEATGQHPAVLKQQVCSPGGTTIAAVRALEKSGLREAIFSAVQAAYQRSKEM